MLLFIPHYISCFVAENKQCNTYKQQLFWETVGNLTNSTVSKRNLADLFIMMVIYNNNKSENKMLEVMINNKKLIYLINSTNKKKIQTKVHSVRSKQSGKKMKMETNQCIIYMYMNTTSIIVVKYVSTITITITIKNNKQINHLQLSSIFPILNI